MFISYLSNFLNASDTTFDVPDGSVFPANQIFELWIDEEKMSCTSVSGNTLTVHRGWEGTSATSHDAETPIALDEGWDQNRKTSKSLDEHIDSATPHLNWIIDEDNMATDSATRVPSQQSVKAYVDNMTTGGQLDWDTVWADAVHSHTSDAEGGVLTSTLLDNTAGGTNGQTAKAPTSNVMYGHANASISSTVHPNTSFCSVYLLTDMADIPDGAQVRIEMDTKIADTGSNYYLPTEKWFNQTQADADSDSTHIQDDDGAFTTVTGKTNGLKYCKVTWSSDAAGTLNTGVGYVTAVADTTLTIVKSSGANFAASYYYTICKSHYAVPVTGVYLIVVNVQFVAASIIDAKRYQANIIINGLDVYRRNVHAGAASALLGPSTVVMVPLTAGDLVSAGALQNSGAGTVDIDGDSIASTMMQIFRLT